MRQTLPQFRYLNNLLSPSTPDRLIQLKLTTQPTIHPLAPVLKILKMFAYISLMAALFLCAFCSTHEDAKLRYQTVVRSAMSQVRENGCGVNVCFAIDTSGSVSVEEFDDEKFFIQDITNIIGVDPRAKFAAAQYGIRSYRISSLTDDVGQFNLDVEFAEFRNDPATSVGAGIVFCDRQLRRRTNDTNKIVVIGDGRNNLGGNPVRRANIFRERANGEVCAVGVGFQDTVALADIANGSERVLAIDDYVELSFIIEDLVSQICGFSLQL